MFLDPIPLLKVDMNLVRLINLEVNQLPLHPNTTTSNIKSSPPTAGAPSYNSMTQDVCAVGASAGLQTFGLGISGGKHFIDKNCERLKLSRILNDFGMKVAAVALLCQDERVFESMDSSRNTLSN